MICLVGKDNGVCVCVRRNEGVSSKISAKVKLKTQLEFIKYIQSLSHYRRENLFLKALIVLAIMGAIFLTCGLSRAAGPPPPPPAPPPPPPPPPPPGAEEREELAEGFC